MIYNKAIFVQLILCFAAFVINSFAMSSSMGLPVTFVNKCNKKINIHETKHRVHTRPLFTLDQGKTKMHNVEVGFSGNFRDGNGAESTLAEITYKPSGKNEMWYDISIIPPSCDHKKKCSRAAGDCCKSLECCKKETKKIGFNRPVSMAPTNSDTKAMCKKVTCLKDGCPKAYHFPEDDIGKVYRCNPNTVGGLTITFCPNGQDVKQTKAPTTEVPTTEVPNTEVPSTTTPTYKTDAPMSTPQPSHVSDKKMC